MSERPHSTRPTSQMPRVSSTKPSSTKPSSTKPSSTKPSSTKPSSTKPSSTKPPSTMPKTDNQKTQTLSSEYFSDKSEAPRKSQTPSSRAAPTAQDKKAKYTFGTIPEDEELDFDSSSSDDFESMTSSPTNYPDRTTSSKKPQSRVVGGSSRAPRAVQSMLASRQFRDSEQADPKKPRSMFPSMMFHDKEFKSLFHTQEDKIMSQRQTQFASLAPKEQKKQENWAQKKIEEMDACPEQYGWHRVDEGGVGGYVCNDGRHVILDEHMAEGLGAICVLTTKGNLGRRGAVRNGPWYPHPTIKNCYVYVKGKEAQGVKSYDQPAFLGSDHQRERAKWEFYKETPEELKRPGCHYAFPGKEPPEEWAFENAIPKEKTTKDK